MTTRQALRELADAYPHRFTSSEVYRTCRADLELTLKESGWPTAKVQAEVDDAILHGLCEEVARVLRR
jgi:hypothetical protein